MGNSNKLYEIYNIEPVTKVNLKRLELLHKSNWNVKQIIKLKLSARQIDILLFRNKDVPFEYRYIKDLNNVLLRDGLSIEPRHVDGIWKVGIIDNVEYLGKQGNRVVWVDRNKVIDLPVFILKGKV